MAHPSEFKAEPEGDSRDRQIVGMVNEMFNLSRSKYHDFRASMQEKYDLVRGIWGEAYSYTGDQATYGWNEVSVNFLHSMIQSDIAKKQLVLFGEKPYVQFVGSGQEDQAKARKRSALVERQSDACGLKVEMAKFIAMADTYGKGVLRYHWERDYGGYYVRERTFRGSKIAGKVDPRTGLRGIKFDGPSCYSVDLQDWFPWPGVGKLDKMPGVGEQLFMDWEDVALGAERGPDGEEPLFDPAAVARAAYQTGPNQRVEDIINNRYDISRENPGDRYSDMRTSWSKPCLIYEGYMRVPRALGQIDPETGEFCTMMRATVLNEQHLLSFVPVPHWDRKPPYVDWGPLVDAHYYYPPGKVEIGARLQAAINKWVSRGLDILDLYADPLWLFDENSGLDPNQLFTGPGNALGVNLGAQKISDVIMQLVPDLRGYNVSMDQVDRMWQWLQQVLGMSADISLGAGEVGSDRQSAHEWVGRERAIDLRQRLELMLLEEMTLIPLWNAFVQMNRQWLPLPREIALIGSNALYDPVTGQIVPPTREILDYRDLEGHLDTYPLGVTRQLSLQSRQANAERALALLTPFLPALNMRAFVMQLLPLFGFPNVTELTNTQQEMQAALAMGLALEQGGGRGIRGNGGANRVRQAGGAPVG